MEYLNWIWKDSVEQIKVSSLLRPACYFPQSQSEEEEIVVKRWKAATRLNVHKARTEKLLHFFHSGGYKTNFKTLFWKLTLELFFLSFAFVLVYISLIHGWRVKGTLSLPCGLLLGIFAPPVCGDLQGFSTLGTSPSVAVILKARVSRIENICGFWNICQESSNKRGYMTFRHTASYRIWLLRLLFCQLQLFPANYFSKYKDRLPSEE